MIIDNTLNKATSFIAEYKTVKLRHFVDDLIFIC